MGRETPGLGKWLAVGLLAAWVSTGTFASVASAQLSGNDPAAMSIAAPANSPEHIDAATPPNTPTPSFSSGGGGNAQPSFAPSLSQIPDLTRRENIAPAMQVIVLLTVLSLAPSILLMMTCFTRIVIVLALLRQALGTQQLPPNQVMVGLALFMTFVVMGPTIAEINNTAIQPYLDGKSGLTQAEALHRALLPCRKFMSNQIEAAGNGADVDLFMDFAHRPRAKKWSEVPTLSLVPAFILSELKTAFLIGFKVYLPFLVIDIVISAILISMGMMMLPPAMVSLPFKLLLFVLVDGWTLICASLMSSFVT